MLVAKSYFPHPHPSHRTDQTHGRLCKETLFIVSWEECVCVCMCVCVCVSHSVVSDCAIPWTVARQAPLSMEFSRQEYWSGKPFSSLGDLPNLGIKPESPALQTDSLLSEPPGKPMGVERGEVYRMRRGFSCRTCQVPQDHPGGSLWPCKSPSDSRSLSEISAD